MHTPDPSMNPGDEAPAGSPGTGEAVCPRCAGRGKLAGDVRCANGEQSVWAALYGHIITGLNPDCSDQGFGFPV